MSGAFAALNLSMKERGKLADACKTRRYNQGDYIITQGQKGTEFFILTSGHTTLHRRDTTGRNPIADPIIDRKYKGDYFGDRDVLLRSNKTRRVRLLFSRRGPASRVSPARAASPA